MWLHFPSSHCAPEADGSRKDSRALSRRIARFAASCTWRGKLSRPHLWQARFERVGWLQHLYGTRSSQFHHQCSERYADWLGGEMSRSPPASLVSPSARRGRGEERATSDGFGQRSHGSLAKYDPPSSSWKTCQASLFTGSDTFSGPWPKRGTLRRGICSARQKRARHTVGSGSSWSRDEYPTPTATAYLAFRSLWRQID